MLFWLLVLGLLIYLLVRGKGSSSPSGSVEYQLEERNKEWVTFIASYMKVADSKAQKALITTMLADIKKQGLVTDESTPALQEQINPPQLEESPATAHSAVTYEQPPTVEYKAPQVELDNASLLLYFGAFLFVASVGLFISFGGASGAIRTLAVLVVMFTMYGSGIWLFRNKPKLQQAGLAFGGIGMTIAPLTGVAAYNYLFSQSNAAVLWGVTSLLCLVMYVHALIVFRRPLISYILIFTFVSLFESSVSIINAPVYYFGWMMAFMGIILAAVTRIKGFWPEMQESSTNSSQLFLPLAVLASFVIMPTYGAGQLGVSLLFATLFYGLEMLNTEGTRKQNNATVTQLSAIASVVTLSYAYNQSWKTVALSLLVANAIQALIVIRMSAEDTLARNFASILLLVATMGVVVGLVSPGILVASLATLVTIGLLVWRRQKRVDGYVLGTLAWMALPLVIGQVLLSTHLKPVPQTALLTAALLIQLSVYVWYKSKESAIWISCAQQLYLISAVVVLFAGFFTTSLMCAVVSLIVAVTMIGLAEHEQDSDWSIAAGLAVCVPVLLAFGKPSGLYDLSVLVALLFNIGFSLRYRKEANRWISTLLWLLVPLALGGGAIVKEWSNLTYAWAYVAVTICLVFSRAVARGNVFLSKHVPMASFAKSASMSYVFGYTLAACIAIASSFSVPNSQLHSTIILSIMTILAFLLGRNIEKEPKILFMLPLLLQSILFNMLRPTIGSDILNLYLIFSTLLALCSYFVWDFLDTSKPSINDESLQIKQASLLMVFIAPAATMVTGVLLLPMPLGLFVAGCLVYYHQRNTTQSNREFSAGIVVASVLWLMYYLGIREVQAYTHVIAAMFAGYAYWRVTRGEDKEADQYLMWMLLTATVPLALQALNGLSGGLYGWWLLLEQIGFMLLGMSIRKPAVTKWGLYVALAAVLYQLRNLGWAALTILAIFLIGMAMYRLQKHDDK